MNTTKPKNETKKPTYHLDVDQAEDAVIEHNRVVAYFDEDDRREVWIFRTLDEICWIQGFVDTYFRPTGVALDFNLPDQSYRIVRMDEWLKATRFLSIPLFPDEFLNDCCDRVRQSLGHENPSSVLARSSLILFLDLTVSTPKS